MREFVCAHMLYNGHVCVCVCVSVFVGERVLYYITGLTLRACLPGQPGVRGGGGCGGPGPAEPAWRSSRGQDKGPARWTPAPARDNGGACWSQCTGLEDKQP